MEPLFIRIGESNGKGQYEWRQLLPAPAGTWSDGPAHGTFGSWPATEANGNASIADGTITVAHLSLASQTLIFQMECATVAVDAATT